MFQRYFKFCLFIHKTFEASWQIIENDYARILCAFLKTYQVSKWSMQMVVVSCVNTVYR
jgi:hypothetical protein